MKSKIFPLGVIGKRKETTNLKSKRTNIIWKRSTSSENKQNIGIQTEAQHIYRRNISTAVIFKRNINMASRNDIEPNQDVVHTYSLPNKLKAYKKNLLNPSKILLKGYLNAKTLSILNKNIIKEKIKGFKGHKVHMIDIKRRVSYFKRQSKNTIMNING